MQMFDLHLENLKTQINQPLIDVLDHFKEF